MPLSSAEKMRRHRARLAEEGGMSIGVTLTPAAAAKLKTWMERGYSQAWVINELLESSKPGRRIESKASS